MLIWKNKSRNEMRRTGKDAKRISRYEGRRARRYEADDDVKAEKPKWIDDELSYVDFVKKLGDEKDPKALAWIELAFGENSEGDIDFEYSEEEVFVGKCKPTQNAVGLGNSLAYPIQHCSEDGVKQQVQAMLDGGKTVKIVKNGKELKCWAYKNGNTYHIIDGHHRWSQVFCFDPSAKMNMVVFTSKPSVKPDQALAAVQAVIKNAVAKQGKALPSGSTKGMLNMLSASENEMKKQVAELIKGTVDGETSPFIDMCSKSEGFNARSGAIQKDLDWSDIDKSSEFVSSFLTKNCMMLHNNPPEVGLNKAPDRIYMPQTDDAGVPASDLRDDLVSGEIAPELLNVKEFRIPKAIKKRYID